MSSLDRATRLDGFLTELGMLVEPLRRLLGEANPSPKTLAFARGQFTADHRAFVQRLGAFGRKGDVWFDTEIVKAKNTIWRFHDLFAALEDNTKRPEVRDKFEALLRESQRLIRAIPTDDPDVILPAASPFQTYLRLRVAWAGAGVRVELFDPYLDVATFHLYPASVLPHVHLTVVTSEALMVPSRDQEMARRDRIVAVSNLLARERPNTYRFLVTPQQHDRHLRLDDKILHLGGSVKDAGMDAPYTISSLDPTQSNHAFLDDIVANATEWFGPGLQKHRRA